LGTPGHDSPQVLLDEVLLSKPWDTVTYRILGFLRRWLVTIVGAPLLVLLGAWKGEPFFAIILLPLLIWIDVLVTNRAWDSSVSEIELARAVVRQVPIPKHPDVDAGRTITRQGFLLAGAYSALSMFAILAFAAGGHSLREIVGPLFGVTAGVLSLAAAIYISLNAAALMVVRSEGTLQHAAKLANAFEPLDIFAPLFVLPRTIRRDVVIIVMLPVFLFVISLHAVALSHVVAEPTPMAVAICIGLFLFQFVCGFVIASLPRMYLVSKAVAARNV
jgi:hypothetical protein